MFKLIAVSFHGCTSFAADTDAEASQIARRELARTDVVSVSLFRDGRCYAVHVDWSNQPA